MAQVLEYRRGFNDCFNVARRELWLSAQWRVVDRCAWGWANVHSKCLNIDDDFQIMTPNLQGKRDYVWRNDRTTIRYSTLWSFFNAASDYIKKTLSNATFDRLAQPGTHFVDGCCHKNHVQWRMEDIISRQRSCVLLPRSRCVYAMLSRKW